MRISSIVIAAVGVTAVLAPRADGVVSLEFRPVSQEVFTENMVEIGLFAVSSNTAGESVSGMDVILTWDASAIDLIDAIANGPHAWSFVFGFLSDSTLDGLNDTFADGNALFQAASFGAATVTPGGLLVATFRFAAIGSGQLTDVRIPATVGNFSMTQVFAPGGAIVTGNLGQATVTVLEAVPTVSQWGLIVLGCLTLTAGSLVIRRRNEGLYASWGEKTGDAAT